VTESVAVLLIAHGSRNPEANADTLFFAERLRRQGEFICVAAAFLEQAEPDIYAAAAICVADGAKRIVLLPLFLSAGIHVRRDLTTAKKRLAQKYPEVTFTLAEPIGQHPLLLEILLERILNASNSPREITDYSDGPKKQN
jgi:sirohydrochlorin ferrochelatase